MEQLPLDLFASPPPSFGTFVRGENTEVVTVLQAWIDGGLRESCVYLWGPAGAGKSHLLQAAVAHARRLGIPAGYAAPGMPLAPDSGEPEGVLAIDAVDALGEQAEAVLFTLLNAAAAGRSRLLLAGGNAPAGLPMRADVRTRIAAGLVLRVRPLTDAEKVDALCRHGLERGFDLPREAAEYLLRHGQRDLPTLMQVLDAADRYSLQSKRPVSVPLLRDVLRYAGRDGDAGGC